MLRSMLLALALAALFGCRHSDSDPNRRPTADDCAQIPKDENNCKGCATLPTCGWCGQPMAGQPNCQPQGDTADKPATCEDGWTHNEIGCPPPPPPPDGESDLE